MNWGSGFLPTSYQGVPLRGQGDPILNLSNPSGVDELGQRRVLDALKELNLRSTAEQPGDVTKGLWVEDGYWTSEPGRSGGTGD